MKIIVRIISLLMAVVLSAGFLTSCDKNSLRPHDDLPAIKPVFLYVGYRYNTTATKYVEYTDEDLQKLNDIGVKEVCISFGNSAASYIPEGESEPKPIVTNEDIDGITMEMIGATSQDSAEIIKAGYKTKLSGLDENLILNDYADFAIEFANRLIAINPDIEIWYSFPDIHIATLAELYIEPFFEYY